MWGFLKMTKIIQFGAVWCGACQQQKPLIEQYCKENNIELIYVDVDKNPEIAEPYMIMALPTIIIEKDNEQSIKFVGFTPIREIQKVMEDL